MPLNMQVHCCEKMEQRCKASGVPTAVRGNGKNNFVK
jgi:hypothetical protein